MYRYAALVLVVHIDCAHVLKFSDNGLEISCTTFHKCVHQAKTMTFLSTLSIPPSYRALACRNADATPSAVWVNGLSALHIVFVMLIAAQEAST